MDWMRRDGGSDFRLSEDCFSEQSDLLHCYGWVRQLAFRILFAVSVCLKVDSLER